MNRSTKKAWGEKLLITVILILSVHFVNAQENYILYGFSGIPQSVSLNPALTPDMSIFVGIPALSNIDVSFFNTVGSYNDFFTRNPGSNVDDLDLSKILKSNNPLGFSRLFINQDLLFAGFHIKNSFFTFGVNQRFSMVLIADNDLFKLIWNKESENVGKVLNLRNTALNETHIIDYHIGLSVPVNSKVTLGARIHLLQGLSNIQTKNDGLSLTTQSDGNGGYNVYATTNLLMNTSGFQDTNNNNGFNTGQYITDFSNIGFAIDLGASVKINDQLSVNASVLDLGSVSYHSSTKSFKTNAANINLAGNLSDIFKSNNALSNLGDTLRVLFNANEFSQSYSVRLPTRVYVGAEYKLAENGGRISLLFADQFFQGYSNMAASLGYDYALGSHLNFKVNYTYIKKDPFNIGTALSFQFKPIQFYVYTDNILTVSWKNSKYAQFGFGLNVLIPNKQSMKTGLDQE